MEVQDILKANFLDILFERRNKAYGAYDLRTVYPKHLKKAGIIILFIALGIMGGYLASKYINPSEFLKKPDKIVDVTELVTPPPMDETKPPPPPPPPPPPVKPTIRFVPPKIEKDELVKEEEVPPKQEELEKDVKISTETKEGDKEAEEVINTDLTDKGGPVENTSNEIFTFVEQMPEFNGGEEAMYKFIQNNIKYPPFALENDITGKVYMEFVINENGEVNDVKCIRDIGGGCGKEAERVIKMLPKWKAGKQNGRPVKVKFSIPVVFETS